MNRRQKRIKEIIKKFSRYYNDLPVSVRYIAGMTTTETRIRQLQLEKKRLNKSHKRSMRQINAHIRALENKILRSDQFEIGREKILKEGKE